MIKTDGLWLMKGDCLDLMKEIPDGSVDLVLCDLPYGTTRNKWDSVIDLQVMWYEYKRVCRGAIVLTAQTPFDKVLGASNLNMLRYEWIWEKPKATGHLNAKRAPMKAHENILVFYERLPIYNPQKTDGEPYKGCGGASKNDNYGGFDAAREGSADGSRYPRSVQKFKHETKPLHPTAKPVALMEYLIKTYTNEGDTVLDNCMGSGTTGVACMNTGRRFIGIEKDESYFKIAKGRIMKS
ncbi:DNA methyltransferase [Klebsiella phage VLCpiS13f]|uniref:DNA methyltransferase n=1 Tax=Klebsiella phage VLCpiS13f TaxID=2874890 RepID=UPI00233EE7F0|nr:DNA methyltransferase [Klebsiella phage VLCpiS13f]UVX29533.1 DNA methyltransferase [Klebsiella phage VLCpiS13f]